MCCANDNPLTITPPRGLAGCETRPAILTGTMLIYFVSGACALIDEVVWVRLLKLTLGNTVYASSIVVSTFMGGLALGAFVMGRYSDRVTKHLRLYALLEAFVTLSAIFLPKVLKLAGAVYVWIYRTYHPSNTQLLAVQVLLSAIVLLVPAMLMGSTLPLLGRFVTALEKETGRLVGKLYAVNTFGAAVGCFLAGFVLLKVIGVMGTVYTAAALNLIAVFGGAFLALRNGEFRTPNVECRMTKDEIDNRKSEIENGSTGAGFYLLVPAFFMSGFISIGYELLWMRSIIHLLSAVTYVFSAVLTVYLLGNVIGAGIGSVLVAQLKRPAVGFAIALSFLGLCGIFYLPLLLLWASRVLPYVDREVELRSRIIPFSAFLVKPLVQSMFLFLVPSVIMGIGFPMALQAWANYVHKVGRSTGTAYAANTIGAVAGGIVTGFVLIPLLGLQLAISILGLAGVWIGAVMGVVFIGRSSPSKTSWRTRRLLSGGGRFALLAVAAVLTVIVAKGPSNLFDDVVNSSAKRDGGLPQLELLAVKEGVVTTVSLYRDTQEDTLHLYTSGQRVAGDSYLWRGDQKMLGHFPVLLNADARKVLSVGFGSGESTACLALHDLDRIDCAEIAPEVVALSLRFFRHINLGDELSRRVNVIYMDAKNYVDLTDIKYDAIVNDCIHPRQFAENASLYTKEYFESAKRRLNSNGLFMSWIPTHHLEPASMLNSIFGTMMDVFPYVTVWYMTPNPATYFLVVGSEQPQYFSPRHIENELRKAGVRESLSLIDINNSMDVFSCYIGDENDLRQCIKSFTVNSDYFPFIEFTTDNLLGGGGAFRTFVFELRGSSIYKHIDWTGFTEGQKSKWLSDYERLYEVSTYLLLSNGADDYFARMQYCMEGLRILPTNPALLDVRERAEKDLFFICKGLIESGGVDKALSVAGGILEIHPQSAIAWMIRSSAMQGSGEMQKALDAAGMAVHFAPDDAAARSQLGFVLFSAGQFEQAVAEYKEALRFAPAASLQSKSGGFDKAQTWNALASAYASAGRFSEAIAAAEKALDLAVSAGRKKMAEDIKKRLLLLGAARQRSCGGLLNRSFVRP
jgi:spermidine synthase